VREIEPKAPIACHFQACGEWIKSLYWLEAAEAVRSKKAEDDLGSSGTLSGWPG